MNQRIKVLKIALASLDISLEEGFKDGKSQSKEEILNNSQDYDKVFLTELGSIYLVKKDGKCQRWKKYYDEDIPYWRLEPETEKIYFLNDDNQIKLISEKKQQEYLSYDEMKDIELDLADYGLGGYPLELGIVGIRTSPRVIEERDKIKVKLNGPFHIGHKITKIIR